MQRFHSPIVEFSLAHPRFILLTILAITLVLTAGMVRVKVDTDPENMLPGSDETRVLNQSIREEFAVTDMIAVGIVEDSGLLTPERLTAVSNLVLEIEALENVPEGVSSFRNLSDLSTGELNEDDVAAVAAAAAANPALAERLVTADGNGLAIFVPLESKDDAASVASSIRSMSAGLGLPDTTEFYIGGLPLAEDTFGRDMFIQMGFAGAALRFCHLSAAVVPVPPAFVDAGGAGPGYGDRDLVDGPVDRGRVPGSHHELDDPDLSDADRDPGHGSRHERGLRPLHRGIG